MATTEIAEAAGEIAFDMAGARQGALNILRNCAHVATGDRVLIVGESGGRAFFDPQVCRIVADVATSIGAHTEIVMAPETTGPEEFPASIVRAMGQVDHTIFFSRIGDQVRFMDLPGTGTKTMCYTHDAGYLDDDFSRVHHGLFLDVLDQLMDRIKAVRHVRIVCPAGTELNGELTPDALGPEESGKVATEFSVNLFPVMIFPPLSCAAMSGQLWLGNWLTNTSTTAYDDSVVMMDAPVFAQVHKGLITRFEGDADETGKIERHFKRFEDQIGNQAYAVNSWHTGIYPKTFYRGDPMANVEKWLDLVYGSPRFTHFHVCGRDPGEIAVSIYDATIFFDDEPCWTAGQFSFLERPEVRGLLDRYPCSPNGFGMCWNIGV
jgi:hypothetical protein